jgi:putative PEP-CTERM system histidine kinase
MTNTGTVSYAIGGGAFLVLTILLATSWRGRLQGGLVVAAACISMIWCFCLAYQASVGGPYSTAIFVLEVVRGGAWLTLLLALLRGPNHMLVSPLVVYGVHGLWLVALLYGVCVALGMRTPFPVSVLALLAIALAGLVLLEQLYRNTRPERRWTIKFLILGLGSIFVYDLFLYSKALLFREMDVDLWDARGAVNAFAVPLIAVAAARNPQWSVDVFVSRQVVFYTTTLLGAGIYLFAMAAGGFYIRLYGGTWGAFAQAVFLGGAALVLAVTMLSSEVRTRARVFVVKHFYKSRYDYRLEWLRLIRTLSTSDEVTSLRERAVRVLAQLVDSPGGGLWLKREEGGGFGLVARWNSDIPGDIVEPEDSPLVRFLEQRGWVIDLMEWRSEPASYDGLALPDWLTNSRGRFVIPIMQESQVLGFVWLRAPQVARRLSWEDTDLLKTAGRQVASYLAQQQAAQALAQARQFDAYHRLTAFIMHDLKNLIAQLSMLVENATRHKHNPAFIEDMIRTVDNSVSRMTQLLDQLKRGSSLHPPKRTALREVLTEVVARHGSIQPVPQLNVLDDGLEVLTDPQALAAILGHVVRNAQEATAPDGHVNVRLARQGANAVVEVEDNGTGMEPAFVAERLFRPFDSTKGSKGMGVGAYQVREFVRAAGGDVEVVSALGKGTMFRITLPALDPKPEELPLPAAEFRK